MPLGNDSSQHSEADVFQPPAPKIEEEEEDVSNAQLAEAFTAHYTCTLPLSDRDVQRFCPGAGTMQDPERPTESDLMKHTSRSSMADEYNHSPAATTLCDQPYASKTISPNAVRNNPSTSSAPLP